MEKHPGEIITDNYPLDRGKISAMEGGTRVPLIITGPGIQAGVKTHVMANGLDFYPTILSLTGSERPEDKHLDGCDLSRLLLDDPTNPTLVLESDGSVRDTMVWHFPHGVAMESTIRIGDFKLIRNYDHVNNPNSQELELYQLYDSQNGSVTRVDIEEAKNLTKIESKRAKRMNHRLSEKLSEMNASYPFYNPAYQNSLPNKDKVPSVLGHVRADSGEVSFTFQENGAKVVKAELIYTRNGGTKVEEWFKVEATLDGNQKATAELPEGTTHYFINLIDENHFLVSYPEVIDTISQRKTKSNYSATALPAPGSTAAKGFPKSNESSPSMVGKWSKQIEQRDSDRNGRVTLVEYLAPFERAFQLRDKNKDYQLSLQEFPREKTLAQADANGDQQLSKEEFLGLHRRHFKRHDTNGDGAITADEGVGNK